MCFPVIIVDFKGDVEGFSLFCEGGWGFESFRFEHEFLYVKELLNSVSSLFATLEALNNLRQEKHFLKQSAININNYHLQTRCT